jgi:Fe-S oxidoreductase
VILFADTFNRYYEPENLRDAVAVLGAAGFQVRPAAAQEGRPLCCGRTYLAAGMVDEARAEARRTLDALSGSDAPVLGLEPSCLTTLRDEFLSLLPGTQAEALAARAELATAFLAKQDLPLKPVGTARAHIHGHCHQKAFGGFAPAVQGLRRIPGLTVTPIASSCCGMAGSFGYEAKNLAVSRAMAELSLLPAIRATAPEDAILADGTSCRHQIRDLAGRDAMHSIRLLAQSVRA